ncbi:leucine-rich PPR motif-containing protein, mitochondrial [Synchiropus splendidus]|uniref:leucine-rich PPR motif-containing protein, mitochondrial n=1 Tax=Synchiropus splendidus TaxID=270530 RepID=UPI00237D4DDF|nr:leucine-rich PPR motif-containing protein, mitochondrial [Synchiropus splendidus]
MAALLRSARLLKFSPSGLLHINGTNRTGPSLSRLYSGALGYRRTGACHRQTFLNQGNVCSVYGPYMAGCVRNFATAMEPNEEAAIAVRSKQAKQFDWALSKLDSSVRRTGRVTKTLLLQIFHDICRTGYPSGNQALLLLRSCGSLLPEVPLSERTELAHRVWDKLKDLGAQYDASHYNALLKVYLQNEFKFAPTDFLAKMEEAGVQPNRVTYQRLIAAYCQEGNIDGSSTILGFMKSKDLPITEAVFSSLVTGHARAGNIDSAKEILTVMKGAGIEPGAGTYVSLLNAYAEKGDIESLKETLAAAESADCILMDRDLMQVVYTLGVAGHQEHIPQILERMRHERGFIPDAINLCLSMITQHQEDTAFAILKSFPPLEQDVYASDTDLGNFFLRHCVNMDTPTDKILHYCKELLESRSHSSPFTFALACALESKKMGMSFELMKNMQEQGLPIRPHYFRPLFTHLAKEKNTAGVVEVIKAMQELGVTPDQDAISKYILPVFPNINAARQALQDANIPMDSSDMLFLEVRLLASSDLTKLHTFLSDPSIPAMDLKVFRSSLLSGFRQSSDVEVMVKVTQLLFNDKRFTKETATTVETVSFFIYNLIESMSEEEMRSQQEKLRRYFSLLQSQNIIISGNVYKGIRNILNSYQVPELITAVRALVDPNELASNSTDPPQATGIESKVLALENKLAELKAEDKPIATTVKQLIQALCSAENLQRALELKQEYEEEMTAGSYAVLINHCCRQDNVEEMLHLKREMSRKDSSATLDAAKYIAVVRVLANNGKVEEAVDVLKEMKEKDVLLSDSNITMLFYTLNSLTSSDGAQTIRLLQDTIFALGLAKPSSNLCSPLISTYLNSGDHAGALDAMMECQKRYGLMPRIHDILVGLVEKGDTDLLQKAMDFMSQQRGEMNMLYDLLFAFLQTGRYKEARKIIETPGLRARPGRLHWFAEKCITNNQMEALEQMVDMTAKLFECDRDEMYSYVLRLCKVTNNWQKAEAVWTKMQEENVIPRDRTLQLLANILKRNNQEVPFEVPETWYESSPKLQKVTKVAEPVVTETPSQIQAKIQSLCKKRSVNEAYDLLIEADKKEVSFSPSTYDKVTRALLSEGSIKAAMVTKEIAESRIPGYKLSDIASSLLVISYCRKGQVNEALDALKSMLQDNNVPSPLSVTRLVQALSNQGDVAGIEEVKSLMEGLNTPLNVTSMLFINNKALAHIKNGDLDLALEMLDELYTSSQDSKGNSMAYVFRKVMEDNNDKALDKLSAMAERLAKHFASYRPALDLFFGLLEARKYEDAKFMLARVNGIAEQKDVLLSYMIRLAQSPGQVEKIQTLQSWIPDFAEKEVVYTYLMKCHVLDKDLSAAKSLYEQMKQENLQVDELSLKRLASLYRAAGETPPFTEPPESFKFYAEKLKERASLVRPAAEE